MTDTIVDAVVALITAQYALAGDTPEIANLNEIRRSPPFPPYMEFILVYEKRKMEVEHVNENYENRTYHIGIAMGTPTSDVRAKDMKNEIRRIISTNALTNITYQHIDAETDVSNTEEPRFMYETELTLEETMVTGTSAFGSYTTTPSISDEAYGVTWNAVTTVGASKNAIYDKIETIISDEAYGATWDGVDTIGASKNAIYDRIQALVLGGSNLADVLAAGNESDGTDMQLDSGSDLIVYSDDGITEVARIDGATGNITTSGTVDGVDIAARDHAVYTDAEAVTAVEAADPLQLAGDIEMASGKDIIIVDDTAQVFKIREGANTYLCITTTDGAEALNIGCGATGIAGFSLTGFNLLSGKVLSFTDGGSVDIIRDEDNMASDDANALATQQSIKKYVDDNAGGASAMTDLTDVSLADPNADHIVFWDDSDSQFEFLVPNTGLAVDGNNLNCSITQYVDADAVQAVEDAGLVMSSTKSISFADGGATVDIIRDEDDMSSDDPNALATQQSIKKYVDDNAGGGSVEDDAWGSGWNADTTNAPSQNAVYDGFVNKHGAIQPSHWYHANGAGELEYRGWQFTMPVGDADCSVGGSMVIPDNWITGINAYLHINYAMTVINQAFSVLWYVTRRYIGSDIAAVTPWNILNGSNAYDFPAETVQILYTRVNTVPIGATIVAGDTICWKMNSDAANSTGMYVVQAWIDNDSGA